MAGSSSKVEKKEDDVEAHKTYSKTLTVSQFAKFIDHYGPVREDDLDDKQVRAELEVAKEYNVRSVCVRPDSMGMAYDALQGTDIIVCAVIGHPFIEDDTVRGKFDEAVLSILAGAHEIDLIPYHVSIVMREWADVQWEILNVNSAVTSRGATMNVVMEDRILDDKQRKNVAKICRSNGIPCVGIWPGSCSALQDDNSDLKVVARHVQDVRKGLRGSARAKVAGCLYDVSDAVYHIASGAHRLGTVDTAMLMDGVQQWVEKGEPLEIWNGPSQYKMTFKKDPIELVNEATQTD
ncbi:deoxyribose-phosphate aldolase [Seiridium cupressi]